MFFNLLFSPLPALPSAAAPLSEGPFAHKAQIYPQIYEEKTKTKHETLFYLEKCVYLHRKTMGD
jgi:hypothetical protein